MSHIEQSTGCVPLDTEILRAGQPGERDKSTGFCDFRLVVIWEQMRPSIAQQRKG